MKNKRPTWEEYFVNLVNATAERGTCDRGKSAAIIVRDTNIIATGYVGSAKGDEHCDEVGHKYEYRLVSEPSQEKPHRLNLRAKIDGVITHYGTFMIQSDVQEDLYTKHCVTGDTVISKFQTGNYNTGHRTIREIYNMWNHPKKVGAMKRMNIRCKADNGLIVSGKILDIWKVGMKQVFKITTKLGRSVETTGDHLFYTEKGWVPLLEIPLESKIALNGVPIHMNKAWLQDKYEVEQLTQSEIAKIAGCSRSTVRVNLLTHGITIRPFKLGGWNKDILGEKNHSYKKVTSFSSSARERSRRYGLGSKCAICNTSNNNLQVHHINRDIYDDGYKNLITLCTPCHALAHSPHAKRETIVFDEIVSITPAGVQTVYDMTTTYHNFVGNGIILHNCIRTIHAEQNAICNAAKHGHSVNGATIYCSMVPCRTCAMMIINSGIIRVVALKDYQTSEHTKKLFKKCGIKLTILDNTTNDY